jgi:phosphoribosyl 1,2-cyclic phosphodiesterase
LRFAVLASGSAGNATVIATSQTVVLIDCGLSARVTAERLGELGLSPDDVDALIVTHEHADHIAGVAPFARRFDVPVHLTRGTQEAGSIEPAKLPSLQTFSPHTPFRIGDLNILPTPVPHDAREPCQFVFESNGQRLGMLTDTGSLTDHIVNHYAACNALIMEFNHDLDLLGNSYYPPSVKRRISGPLGHLSNDQAASLVTLIDKSRLRYLVAAHVSQRTNTRDRVATILGELSLDGSVAWAIADQDQALPWHEL